MSRMSELHLDLQKELARGELSFYEIAEKYEIPVHWVEEVAVSMSDYFFEEDTPTP